MREMNTGTTQASRGKAYLVGAGPGRPDLITVRGLRLLQQADVILYDRLVATELLLEARAEAKLIYVGKGPGHHTASQDEINQQLVDHVLAGQQVVRLKGGDPFVFGRGGEEALALQAAGLPFEIVPGISAALAVPAYAGIPITHRGIATSFAVVTGHECSTSSQTNWSALAQIPTLIVMMGVEHIEEIAHRLIQAGRATDTPSAAISWGCTDQQQVVSATLETIAFAIEATELVAPAVIVIGDVAAMHEQLAWFWPNEQMGSTPMPVAPPQQQIELPKTELQKTELMPVLALV